MATRFFVHMQIPTVELTIEEIWPDGDAPENPTAEDVAAVMLSQGSRRQVMTDWGLGEEISLEVGDGRNFATVWGR